MEILVEGQGPWPWWTLRAASLTLTPLILIPGTRVTLPQSQDEPILREQMVTLTLKKITQDNKGLLLSLEGCLVSVPFEDMGIRHSKGGTAWRAFI